MTYEVQLAALKSDADTWDETSSTLLTACNSAWGLSLGEYELSWAAETVGLTTTYSSIQTRSPACSPRAPRRPGTSRAR